MAMQEALARICDIYSESMPEGSSCYIFGRRNQDGMPVRTAGDRLGLRWSEIQFEDLEGHVYNLEEMLRTEMEELDWAKGLLQQNKERIIQAERAVEWLGDQRDKLRNDNYKLKNVNEKLEDKALSQEAQILGLQGQCAHLVQKVLKLEQQLEKETSTIQQMPATPQTPAIQEDQEMGEVEEEPQEVLCIMPNGEQRLIVPDDEDTPATNTRSHTPRISAKAYARLFKN